MLRWSVPIVCRWQSAPWQARCLYSSGMIAVPWPLRLPISASPRSKFPIAPRHHSNWHQSLDYPNYVRKHGSTTRSNYREERQVRGTRRTRLSTVCWEAAPSGGGSAWLDVGTVPPTYLVVPCASLSSLLISAAAIERRIRGLRPRESRQRSRLIFISEAMRDEMRRMEGLLSTLFAPPTNSVQRTPRCRPQ